MKAEIRDIEGKKYLLLPSAISSQELEIFKLKDGFYLLTFPLEQPKKEPEEKLSEEEKQLLIDISMIRFEQRTLANVKKMLSKKQLDLLKSLIKRGYVSIFKKGKYKDVGVLNFTDEVFAMLKEEKKKMRESAEAKKEEKEKAPYSEKPFFILSKDRQNEIGEFVAKGYLAVIGMDNKIYVARAKNFLALSSKIKEALKHEEKTVGEIARELGEDSEAVDVVLKILWAQGEVMEARKDVFALVE
ncbi:MAG: hypothetical protein QXL47_00535 [Candidatus Anstonellales archaeon]